MKTATKAKKLIAEQKMAVLSTNSRRHDGFPFGSVVPYALDHEDRPLLLISSLAVHHRNLAADGRASLTVFDDEAHEDPLSSARVTVMGEIAPVPEDDLPAAREAYLKVHPNAGQWIGFSDFTLLRMKVKDLYFIGGFGSMGWILPEDYRAATS